MSSVAMRACARSSRSFLVMVLIGFPSRALHAQGTDAARGAAHFAQGDLAAARSDFEAVLGRNARDPNAHFFMGKIALQDGRSGEAVDWLEKAIDIDGGVAEYHAWLGNALGQEAMNASKLRQPFLARRVRTEFEKAVELDPRSVAGRQGLIQFYAMAPGFMGGGLDKARAQAAELRAVNPLQGELANAYLAVRQRDTVAALRAYEAAISAAPDSAVGYLTLGSVYVQMQRWADAFATFDRYLARHPDDPAAIFQIGRTAALSGQRLEGGEQALRRWLANPPADAPRVTLSGAHNRLGQILARTGRTDAARVEMETALRINPKNDDARKSLEALP